MRKLKRKYDWLHPKNSPTESPFRNYYVKNNKMYWPFATNYGTLPAGRMESDGGRRRYYTTILRKRNLRRIGHLLILLMAAFYKAYIF